MMAMPTPINSRGIVVPSSRYQRGVALFVGLVFLVMLSLVALMVMKDTLLEMRMTTATARHEQAFEASERMRVIPEAILADHVFNRGWPVSWGGSVPDGKFDLYTTFAHREAWIDLINPKTNDGEGLQTSCGGSNLVIFYMPQTCVTHTESYNYDSSAWDDAVVMNTCANGSKSCGASQKINSRVAIVRDGVMLNKGSGAASQQGYSSVGVGTAKGGGALLLQVRSDTKVPGNGEAATIAQYKLEIK
jgi:Tfp pilus assembly protein PilX